MAKTEQFLFRMTPELKARLQKAAADDGRSAASYVEQLIIADLDRKDEMRICQRERSRTKR
jgi:predicted DNA-binding protein